MTQLKTVTFSTEDFDNSQQAPERLEFRLSPGVGTLSDRLEYRNMFELQGDDGSKKIEYSDWANVADALSAETSQDKQTFVNMLKALRAVARSSIS